MKSFVSLFLVVTASAINYVERLVSEMTYHVSSGMLNPTHSTTKIIQGFLDTETDRHTGPIITPSFHHDAMLASKVTTMSHLNCLDVSKLRSKMKWNISSVWHATMWTSITLNNQHPCNSSVITLTCTL